MIRKDLKSRMLVVADTLQTVSISKIAAAKKTTNFNLGDPVCITKSVLVVQSGGRQVDVKKGTKGVISGITQKNKGRYKVNFHGNTDVIIPAEALKFDRAKAPRPEVKQAPGKPPKQPKQPKPTTTHASVKKASEDVAAVAKECALAWSKSNHLPAGPTTLDRNKLHDALGREPTKDELHEFVTVFKEHLNFRGANK